MSFYIDNTFVYLSDSDTDSYNDLNCFLSHRSCDYSTPTPIKRSYSESSFSSEEPSSKRSRIDEEDGRGDNLEWQWSVGTWSESDAEKFEEIYEGQEEIESDSDSDLSWIEAEDFIDVETVDDKIRHFYEPREAIDIDDEALITIPYEIINDPMKLREKIDELNVMRLVEEGAMDDEEYERQESILLHLIAVYQRRMENLLYLPNAIIERKAYPKVEVIVISH